MATAAEKLLTFDEVARLDPDERVTKNTWRRGEVVVNVSVLLREYARRHPGWSVAAADPGTKLRSNPDTLRGPDVAIVRADRVPKGKGSAGWLAGAPDVAVEVMGDEQTAAELARKAAEYLRAGAKQVWNVDAAAESVIVYTPPDRFAVLGKAETLDGGEALRRYS